MDDLAKRCKEIVEWKSTGILHGGSGGALRAYVDRLVKQGIPPHYALSVAENNTATEAMELVVKLSLRVDNEGF